jgi:hypothetical protein
VKSETNPAGPWFDSKAEEYVYRHLRDITKVYYVNAHPLRIILAKNCTYEPDIMVVKEEGQVPVFLEVKPADKDGNIVWRKGGSRGSGKTYTSDGKIKWRIAQAQYPIWDWAGVGVSNGRIMKVEGDIGLGFFMPKDKRC